jgi:hypothetical protein
MDFYSVNVVALGALNAALSYLQWKKQDGRAIRSKEMAGGVGAESILAANAVNTHFKKRFLPVYLLVFGADWLQVRHCQATGTCILTRGQGSLHIYHVQR